MLVQQSIELIEILEAFLDIAVFPEPILSSADVVQHMLDVIVAKRLPRVVIEDSGLYVESYNCSSHIHTSAVTSVIKMSP